MRSALRLALLVPIVGISGCVSMLSGLGGTQSYACQAPIGAQCTSISGIYARAMHGMSEVPHPPETQPIATRVADKASGKPAISPSAASTQATSSIVALSPLSPSPALNPVGATALRSPPRVLRLWIAPWEDADGDLHDASVVHVVVDTGHWLIERVRPVPRARLDGIKPPMAPVTPSPATADGSPAGGRAAPSSGSPLVGPDVLPAAP